MSCIITYKGQKYSEEQFKEYFINNKQEFVTSIAKNKNVIDSFKRKMEGIDYVFSQSPELASIGSKAQYLQYLSTIFKTSKVKDIVYHGTSFGKFDKFNKDELGKNTEAPSSLQGFFFSNSKVTAGNYAQKTEKDWGEISLEESIERNEDSKDNNQLYYELVEKSDYTDKRDPFGEGSIVIKSKNKELYFGEFEDFTEEHKKALDDLKTIEKEAELLKKQNNKLQLFAVVLNIKNPKVEDKKGESGNINQIIKSVKTTNDGVVLNNYKDPFISDVYVVFEPEQIHILGSKQDIEGFKQFVKSPTINKVIKLNLKM